MGQSYLRRFHWIRPCGALADRSLHRHPPALVAIGGLAVSLRPGHRLWQRRSQRTRKSKACPKFPPSVGSSRGRTAAPQSKRAEAQSAATALPVGLTGSKPDGPARAGGNSPTANQVMDGAPLQAKDGPRIGLPQDDSSQAFSAPPEH